MSTTNPFNPNGIVSPSLFAGRIRQIDSILMKLSAVKEGMHSSFILHGERGIGKTALAKFIKYFASENENIYKLNFKTSYYAVEKNQTLKNALEVSINRLVSDLPSSALQNIQLKIKNFFKNGRFTFRTSLLEGDFKNKKIDNNFFKDETIQILSHLIDCSVCCDPNSKKDGFLIIIDEIHNLTDLESAAQNLRSILNTLDVDNKSYVSFLLIGYSDYAENLLKHEPSSKRLFDSIELKIMSEIESEELLKKGLDKVELTYEQKELSEFSKYAGGYPHSLQILGYNAYKMAKNRTIDKKVWLKAIVASAFTLKQNEFSNYYSFEGRKTLKEKIMNILASVHKPIDKSTLAKVLKGKNIYQEQYLPKLIAQGAVKENSSGVLSLQSTLFRSAILINLKEDDRNELGKLLIHHGLNDSP